jgi:hypothetical protein
MGKERRLVAQLAGDRAAEIVGCQNGAEQSGARQGVERGDDEQNRPIPAT